MNPFTNNFERKWLFIFLFLYFITMLPLPWLYSTKYVPSLFGTPLFIYGWICNGFIVICFIFAWWRSCISREEYREFDKREE